MQNIFTYLKSILPFLHLLALIGLITKIIFIKKNKTFTMDSVVWSFFRIYTMKEMNKTQSKTRLKFMILSNFINYYFYLWIIITVMTYIVTSSADTNALQP